MAWLGEVAVRHVGGWGIPILACLCFTRSFAAHSTRVAPELSMQVSIDCVEENGEHGSLL